MITQEIISRNDHNGSFFDILASMKTLILSLSLLLTYQSFAAENLCAPLFEDLITAKESIIFSYATNIRMQLIENTTRELELYDGGDKKEVKVGDMVSLSFIEPILSDMPTTTGSVTGYMLGSRKMIDPKTGEAKLYYFVMDPSFEMKDSGPMQVILAFTKDNIEPFKSTIRRDLGFKYKDNYN